MQNYLDLLQDILIHGVDRNDRTGVGTRSVFGRQLRFDLQQGLPLITTKKLHLASIIYELLWFIRGDTNIAYLNDHNVSIWNEWADIDGNLGPVYGKQWRAWPAYDGGYIDQLQVVLNELKTNPNSRRLIVASWNVGQLEQMALPPCHLLFQFYVADNKLSCQLYQRSCDTFLGLPFNIASYALLTHMVAAQSGLQVGEFVWTGGDVHLYHNHFTQAKLQLQRQPLALPKLRLQPRSNIFMYEFNDFMLENYETHPHIKAKVAV